jgi:hypothetical protein
MRLKFRRYLRNYPAARFHLPGTGLVGKVGMPDPQSDGHEAIRLAIDVIRAGHLRPCTRRPSIHGSQHASGLGVAQVAREGNAHGLPDSRLRRKADTQSGCSVRIFGRRYMLNGGATGWSAHGWVSAPR